MTLEAPLVVLVGPTAVGKTAVSLSLARRLKAEIISADSRLVYQGMDIGTAKPTPRQRAQVPHHMIDVAPPNQTYSLAAYRRAALAAIDDIHRRGRLPILVGGTGQYVMAVVEGWQPPPKAEDRRLRRQLEAVADEQGAQALHARLAAVDPDRARAIDPRNVRRVIRALEIYQVTGQPASRQRVKKPPPYAVLQLGLTLPRAELYRRIEERIEGMLAAGWLDEVGSLLEAGLAPNAPPMSAIGYRQLVDHLQGELSLDAARWEISRRSRQFIRRQANWFKPDDPNIRWFTNQPGVVDQMLAVIEDWLADG